MPKHPGSSHNPRPKSKKDSFRDVKVSQKGRVKATPNPADAVLSDLESR